jgi:hypothetical protein
MKKRRPTPPLSTIKTLGALTSIFNALDGEPGPLAARLREGSASKEEMAVAADLIEKNAKPRPGRSRFWERLAIAETVRHLRTLHPKWQRKQIISETVDSLKKAGFPHVSERHVYNVLEEFDDNFLAHILQMSLEANDAPVDLEDALAKIQELADALAKIRERAGLAKNQELADALAKIKERAGSLARK